MISKLSQFILFSKTDSTIFFRLSVEERTNDYVSITNNDNKVKLHARPFKIEFFKNGNLVSVVNARGLMNFEHLRTKEEKS